MAKAGSTYRAIHVVSPGKLELTEKPLRDPKPGHVRVRKQISAVVVITRVGDVEADGIAGLERGALRQEQRQSAESGFADRIHIAIAGQHISELGLQRRARRVLDLRVGAAAGQQRQRNRGDEQHCGSAGARGP